MIAPRRALLCGLVVVLSVVSGCGGGGDATPPGGATCAGGVPSSCSGSPGFQAHVMPVIEQRCFPCHAPGGKESSRLLTSYAQISPQRSSVLTQVASCVMPPSDGTPLTPAERTTILDWLVCGAPDD